MTSLDQLHLRQLYPSADLYIVVAIFPTDSLFRPIIRYVRGVDALQRGFPAWQGIALRKRGLLASGVHQRSVRRLDRTGVVPRGHTLFLDVDTYKLGVSDKKAYVRELRERHDVIRHALSACADSGQGLHFFLYLREPRPVDELQNASRVLSRTLGLPDHTGDAARVARMPGSYNTRTTPPRRCGMLFVHPRRRHHLDEVLDMAQEPCRAPPPAPAGPLQQAPPAHTDVPAAVQAVLDADWHAREYFAGRGRSLGDQSASAYDMALALRLLRHGVSPSDVRAALMARRPDIRVGKVECTLRRAQEWTVSPTPKAPARRAGGEGGRRPSSPGVVGTNDASEDP